MDSSANLFQKNMTWSDFFNAHQKTKQNKTKLRIPDFLAGHCHVKEENDYSLIWLDLFKSSGHGLMILYRFSQFNVTWISGEFEKKHKSAMRNCTLSTFILLGLQMILHVGSDFYVSVYFLYIEYTGNLTILILTFLVDSHLKTAM